MTENLVKKMIDFYDGSLHDINHFLKVLAYAKTIAGLEGLDDETVLLTEVSAICHDIACPLCRAKYGSADGRMQELEGPALTREFLKDSGLTAQQTDRVCVNVGHHHTPFALEGMDFQILIEADYLVNADESHFSRENIANTCEKIFRTPSGIALLKSIYKI